MKKACVKCGAPLEEGTRFCGGCGSQQPGAVLPQAAARPNAKTMFQGGGPPAAPNVGTAKTLFQSGPPAPRPPSAEGTANTLAAVSPRPVPAPAPSVSAERTAIGDLAGRTLNNRYLVEEKIGEGGFGAVYRARQVQMNRVVALKVLHAKMAKDPQVIGRFKREAQASSLLRAPHTVQVYDFDQTPEGLMYLAMEMLNGQSLHSVMHAHGALEPARVARILDGIAESLGEAHGHGIVHRDIKPENVYLEPKPTPDFVKVLDFGIAKIMSGDGGASAGPALTAAGQTLGTLEYMSPEQLMGQALDGRSDLYALGILAYEMLTGRLPFPSKTPGEMITGHLRTVPSPPSESAPDRQIPAAFDRVVLRLLEKNRDARYADAAALRADLHELASGRPVASAPPKHAAAAPAPAAAPAHASAPRTDRVVVSQPRAGLPMNVVLLLVGIVVAICALGGGVLFFLSKK